MSITVHNCPFCDHDDVEIGETGGLTCYVLIAHHK